MTGRPCPALFIAAPASGQGKTTVTAALARRHRDLGRRVRVFKTGPDFLDPLILERASGAPVYQLDLWMGGEDHCRQLLYQAAGEADLILVEGVMGLFDGDCSSADLAALFGIPVMAVIDGSHMAQTFGALALGLANYRPGLPFAGAFANRLAGERHYQMLADALPPGLPCLGWLPREADIALPARHLGLVAAAEIADLEARLDQAAAALRLVDLALPAAVNFRPALAVTRRQATPLRTKDIPVTFTLTPGTLHSSQANADPPPPHPLPRGEGELSFGQDTDAPSPLVGEGWGEGDAPTLHQRHPIAQSQPQPLAQSQPRPLAGVRIAVARDAAFAFLYRANLELLQALGAELAFFSPLADPELPPADALYLPGGYPELHLERLAANQALLAAVRAHHAADKPLLAECGGMLYLLESLTDQQGRTASLAGLLPGRGLMGDRLANLGMHEIDLPEGTLRGHGFHYSRLETPLEPIAWSRARRGRQGEPAYRLGSLLASYLHLYFPSNPAALVRVFAPNHPYPADDRISAPVTPGEPARGLD